MTLDRLPDLDNANVGIYNTVVFLYRGCFQAVSYFFAWRFKMVHINGKNVNVGGKSLNEYLSCTEYDIKRIAVEINGNIVSRSQYDNVILSDGDSVEIVSFVGGG